MTYLTINAKSILQTLIHGRPDVGRYAISLGPPLSGVDEMAHAKVHSIASDASPTRVIAPAVANVLASVSGRRCYCLPVQKA